MTRQAIGVLAVLVTGGTWTSSPLAAQQAMVATHWHAAAANAEMFAGSGWGASLGATRGLYNESSLVAGAGIDVSWTRPSLSGARAPGSPIRRALFTLEANLRRRLLALPGGIGFEAGIPIGMAWSRIDEGSATQSGSELPAYEETGGEVGATAGGLAALRVPLRQRAALLTEARVLHAWIYGQREWIEVYRIGLAVRF